MAVTRGSFGQFRALSFDEDPGERAPASAMTPAERQARRRAMVLGGIRGHLDEAEVALQLLDHELLRLSPDAAVAMESLKLHLAEIRGLLPKPKSA